MDAATGREEGDELMRLEDKDEGEGRRRRKKEHIF